MAGVKKKNVYFPLKAEQDVTINQWGWALEKHTRNSFADANSSLLTLLEITYINPVILSLLKIFTNFPFGTVLGTSVQETTHTHKALSFKESVSLLYSYILFLTKWQYPSWSPTLFSRLGSKWFLLVSKIQIHPQKTKICHQWGCSK